MQTFLNVSLPTFTLPFSLLYCKHACLKPLDPHTNKLKFIFFLAYLLNNVQNVTYFDLHKTFHQRSGYTSLHTTHIILFPKCWLGSWLQFVKHLCWDVLRFFSGIFYSCTLAFFPDFIFFHSSFYFSLAMQLQHPLMSPFSPLPSTKCPRSVSNGEEDRNRLPVTCM